MGTANWIALALELATLGEQLAFKIYNESGLTDDQLKAQIAADDQATRDSIDAFLASLPPKG